jgi:hypothetical protein
MGDFYVIYMLMELLCSLLWFIFMLQEVFTMEATRNHEKWYEG